MGHRVSGFKFKVSSYDRALRFALTCEPASLLLTEDLGNEIDPGQFSMFRESLLCNCLERKESRAARDA
jgi:hypothetical protein